MTKAHKMSIMKEVMGSRVKFTLPSGSKNPHAKSAARKIMKKKMTSCE